MARSSTPPPSQAAPPRAARLSIREVAKRADVSIGTVSHVLNRPEIVRPALRERVLAVIQQLSFEPNAVAVNA